MVVKKWVLILIFLFFISFSCVYASTLNFEYYTYQGAKQSLANHKGRYVLLNLFASYCPSCMIELNSLNKVSKACPNSKVQVVSLMVDRESSYLLPKLVASKSLTYEVGLAPANVNKFFPDFSKVPTTYLLNPEGKVIERIVGFKSSNAFLQLLSKYVSCN
ncbi:TlpA family protein disulfide reductase [Thermodesulfobacterium sp. TA1]|uniref:TlpA family protein disulfide reductase n=1 Tax=Thermodesulfobacterium sp. TA1 TaxID=2234087 RepID=UPI0012329B7A|nr:TlpA disulfide reductase family protein [Thermodesulfobacterium sp. TA1]QER41746.1 TlpA family protein disulfide reductase [Thermodesulfobacterium sp. TA1]